MSQIQGSLLSPDAHALNKRLTALAATVCAHDPRTREQRRADALGALAAGADRLACRCGRSDCAAGKRPPASPVVIHVIAEQATLRGAGASPGSQVGADGLICPELVAELASPPSWCRWFIRATPRPNRAMCPRKRWRLLCAAGI